MSEQERLRNWMRENGFTYRRLATITGDSYPAIHMMTHGRRAINQAFKWRFARAFGFETASRLFDGDTHTSSQLTTEQHTIIHQN